MRVTRADVIEAAAQLADQRGLNGVSLKAVAEALQLRAPSLYNHVASLEELLQAVAHQGMREMNARMERAAVGVSGEEAILAVSTAYLRAMIDHPGVYETIQWAAWHGTEETRALLGQYRALLETLLRPLGLQEGLEEALDLLAGTLHGYGSTQLGRAIADPDRAENALRRAISAVLSGIRLTYAPAD